MLSVPEEVVASVRHSSVVLPTDSAQDSLTDTTLFQLSDSDHVEEFVVMSEIVFETACASAEVMLVV